MNFQDLVLFVAQQAETETFSDASENVQREMSQMNEISILNILANIGTIPESCPHDSTFEKLFAKTADMVLAETLNRLGFRAVVFRERGDSADVAGSSPVYGYTFVADAKTFRLSRTAKNQKDFKVQALSGWRNHADYAILVAPYFQYPRRKSLIYRQAMNSNVCLFSWEHLAFLLKNHVREDGNLCLLPVWNMSRLVSEQTIHSEAMRCENFQNANRTIFCDTIRLEWADWLRHLDQCCCEIRNRSMSEIEYWENYIQKIQSYPREQAVQELLSALKLRQKIATIKNFIGNLPDYEEIES